LPAEPVVPLVRVRTAVPEPLAAADEPLVRVLTGAPELVAPAADEPLVRVATAPVAALAACDPLAPLLAGPRA
jgi:hypothetical protein